MMKKYVHGGDIYRNPSVLDFSANINPLGTPSSVLQAAAEGLQLIAHYPDAHQEKLKEALSLYEEVPTDWLICGNGAAELIFLLAQALQPKKALLPAPTFAEYEQALRSVGCEICYEFLKEENGFVLQESILERLTEDMDFFVLCNPNNPTGLLVEQGLADRILETCRTNHICLLADECFLDFVDEGEALSFKNKLISGDKVFLLKAFTKRYAMAGLRLGYGICPDRALLDAMEFRVQPWNISTPAQMAGIAALKEEQYVRQSMDLIRKEKEYLRKELQDLGCLVYDSRANYLFFKGESDLGQKLLKEKIMIRDCSNYPGLSEGYYRIAVKLPDENRKLVETMKRVGCGNICER